MNESRGTVLGGSLLIAGTSIGGGMLALPVLTGNAGFIPSLFIYLLCWFFMACTGLLFLEISGRMKKESNIVSMAEHTLGSAGKYIAWILYLFLFYCLTVAYMVGCGNIIVNLFGASLPDWSGPILFTAIFAPMIFLSGTVIEKLNMVLVAGLAICFFGFVFLGYRYVRTDLLLHSDWSYSLNVLPIAFISFAYQGIIPTLATYMHGDRAKIRKSILIGSFIPLLAYAVWEWLILGIVPLNGEQGLNAALAGGNNAVYPLKHFIQNEFVYTLAQFFAFFALVTSFLGVTLGLRDFLADGLKIKKEGKGKVLLAALVLFLPLVIAVTHPHVFLLALEYAGGFGSALLLGLLPVIMVWVIRYRLHSDSNRPELPGGKILLALPGIFVGIELIAECRQLFYRI